MRNTEYGIRGIHHVQNRNLLYSLFPIWITVSQITALFNTNSHPPAHCSPRSVIASPPTPHPSRHPFSHSFFFLCTYFRGGRDSRKCVRGGADLSLSTSFYPWWDERSSAHRKTVLSSAGSLVGVGPPPPPRRGGKGVKSVISYTVKLFPFLVWEYRERGYFLNGNISYVTQFSWPLFCILPTEQSYYTIA
jgi:hypothetical protein